MPTDRVGERGKQLVIHLFEDHTKPNEKLTWKPFQCDAKIQQEDKAKKKKSKYTNMGLRGRSSHGPRHFHGQKQKSQQGYGKRNEEHVERAKT